MRVRRAMLQVICGIALKFYTKVCKEVSYQRVYKVSGKFFAYVLYY